MSSNRITEQWRFLAELTQGNQKEYFERKVKDGHEVKCVSVDDVFTEEELDRIHEYCRIEPKMCFRTAYMLTTLFPSRVKYVEGELAVLNGNLGIEHAWNLVDGQHYVDLTLEIALGNDVTKETYVALGEYDVNVMRDVACETRMYGGVYNTMFIREIKKKERKQKRQGKNENKG